MWGSVPRGVKTGQIHPHPFPSTSTSEEEIKLHLLQNKHNYITHCDKTVHVFEIKNCHLRKGLPFHFTTCMPFEFFTVLMCSLRKINFLSYYVGKNGTEKD